MLFSIRSLSNCPIHAQDGEIGKADQFFFDDEKWALRYLIVKTGSWFNRTRVLISPLSILKIDIENRSISLKLTREQVEKSPDVDTEKPFSRQMEMRFMDHYKWPYYWTGEGIWGTSAILEEPAPFPPLVDKAAIPNLQELQKETTGNDIHLRSTKAVFGHRISAMDGVFGHVDDFIVDDEVWAIRYLVVVLRKWWPSKIVLISRDWVQSINWDRPEFQVGLLQDEIRKSPEYNPSIPISCDYEILLRKHFDQQMAWKKSRGSKISPAA